jgi:hypothetical protein
MRVFLFSRLRTWLLLAVALPLARLLVHRLAVAADRPDPSARTARLLNQAGPAVTTVSGRVSQAGRDTATDRQLAGSSLSAPVPAPAPGPGGPARARRRAAATAHQRAPVS